jgi:hypothetical protein
MAAESNCVVLVPVGGGIEPFCEEGLRTLESRGYEVRRVRGFTAIDVARNQIASDALADGFDELMWIDSDIGFDPDAVEQLRSHQLPFVCGLYAKKGRREFACMFRPETEKVQFGPQGGLLEVQYVGFGFVLVRREVFETIQRQLKLPTCNERFSTRRPIVPFFQPLVIPDGSSHWYLGEDYAFCHRATESGFSIWADSSIRLFHVGSYAFSWEDAGGDPARYTSYVFHIRGGRSA